MRRVTKFALSSVLATVVIIAEHSPVSSQVNIGISVGTPPPPPAPVVIQPVPPVATPAYYYGGWYYTYYDGAWFVGERHEGPWALVEVDRVPRRVLGLPRAYERIPPGHLRKVGPHPWARTEGEDEREDRQGRGHEARGHEDRDHR